MMLQIVAQGSGNLAMHMPLLLYTSHSLFNSITARPLHVNAWLTSLACANRSQLLAALAASAGSPGSWLQRTQ
jgi:hypothetical protein